MRRSWILDHTSDQIRLWYPPTLDAIFNWIVRKCLISRRPNCWLMSWQLNELRRRSLYISENLPSIRSFVIGVKRARNLTFAAQSPWRPASWSCAASCRVALRMACQNTVRSMSFHLHTNRSLSYTLSVSLSSSAPATSSEQIFSWSIVQIDLSLSSFLSSSFVPIIVISCPAVLSLTRSSALFAVLFYARVFGKCFSSGDHFQLSSFFSISMTTVSPLCSIKSKWHSRALYFVCFPHHFNA